MDDYGNEWMGAGLSELREMYAITLAEVEAQRTRAEQAEAAIEWAEHKRAEWQQSAENTIAQLMQAQADYWTEAKRATVAEAALRKLDSACAAECCAHAETLERLARAEAAMLALAAPCRWTVDAEGTWHSGCGQTWWFGAGTPDDNNCVYCARCGHPLTWELDIPA